MATAKQVAYINHLADSKTLDDAGRAWLDRQDLGSLSNRQVDDILARLKKLPYKTATATPHARKRTSQATTKTTKRQPADERDLIRTVLVRRYGADMVTEDMVDAVAEDIGMLMGDNG